MIILGLDPGLATTGYGVIEKGRGQVLTALDWGIIETKNNKSFSERLEIITCDLKKILKRHRPALAVVESIYFAKNVKTAINVAHARGVILLILRQKRVKILELTPLQMKFQITGYGAAQKTQVQDMVKRHLKLKQIPKPDDAADALALAICGTIKQRI